MVKKEVKTRGYLDFLQEYPKTLGFFEGQGIVTTERFDSLWRKDNLVLRVECSEEEYVFKRISEISELDELDRIKKMKGLYPNLFPDLFVFERDSYVMSYIDGDSFFNIPDDKRVEGIARAGKILRRELKGKDYNSDISYRVRISFERYRERREMYFLRDELRLKEGYFLDLFGMVNSAKSHNDLNAANLLYCENGFGIKLIDPSDEGFEDYARDIGRYCASVFFNNYDYFGNDKKKSLEIAEVFLSNFKEEDLERAKYFIGESFLSFLRFDTVSVPKSVLKKLCINLLTKKGKILHLLEECL